MLKYFSDSWWSERAHCMELYENLARSGSIIHQYFSLVRHHGEDLSGLTNGDRGGGAWCWGYSGIRYQNTRREIQVGNGFDCGDCGDSVGVWCRCVVVALLYWPPSSAPPGAAAARTSCCWRSAAICLSSPHEASRHLLVTSWCLSPPHQHSCHIAPVLKGLSPVKETVVPFLVFVLFRGLG